MMEKTETTSREQTKLIGGRSLWADARIRLMQNKAAVFSIVLLFFVALAAFFGPSFTGHDYQKSYQSFTQSPPNITPIPTQDQIAKGIKDIARTLRATIEDEQIEADKVKVTFTFSRPFRDRYLEYFPRSEFFLNPNVLERNEDGTRIVIEAPVKKNYFLFGTDINGRDILTRTFMACRISLAIGLVAALVATLIGITYGATSGYLGGRIDLVMMRFVDIMYSLPFIFFVIMLMTFFGRNFLLMFVAIGAVEWLDMARIVRGQTLSIKRQEYVQAADALGVRTFGIIKRHIIPNTLGPVIVYMTLLVPKVILLESFLSFIGMGVQEPATSLGVLIAEGAKKIQDAPWMLIYPSIFLIIILFCLNFIGDGLRDALDPKDR